MLFLGHWLPNIVYLLLTSFPSSFLACSFVGLCKPLLHLVRAVCSRDAASS